MAGGTVDLTKLHWRTRLTVAGRDHARSEGAINPPVQRASTLVLDDADDLYGKDNKTYAIDGMAAQEALRAALQTIEGGEQVVLTPSGLSACTLALMTAARPGGEMLVADCVYGPTRRFCDTTLKRFGVATRYFPARAGADIAAMMHENTCGVFMESPGSLTFELQDARAIAAAAQSVGAISIIDNTWSAGIYFDPFKHGIDLSVQALTKYQNGHADVFMGSVSGNGAAADLLAKTHREIGHTVSPDDAYLVLRGIRTLGARLELQSASALRLAEWLDRRPEVVRVLHPALPSSEDHDLWRRDFTGASGVFGFVLRDTPAAKLKAMLESLTLFAMGFSWGGYESLIVPCDPQLKRTASAWTPEGPLVRVSIGLEDSNDLAADLEHAFTHLN